MRPKEKEINSVIANADSTSKEFIDSWLSKRKNILGENIKTYNKLRNPGIYTNYTDAEAENEYGRQIKNMNSASISLKDIIETGSYGLTGSKGSFDRKANTINLSTSLPRDTTNPLLDDVIIHERTHASRAYPQETVIKDLLSTYLINSTTDQDKYLNNSSEIYSRLMSFRKLNNLDPNKVITKEDIKTWTKDKSLFKNDLNKYPTKFLLDLFNTVAQNKLMENTIGVNPKNSFTNLLT